jgi:D-glucosaminate-6-phosphate ammonia-lyase
MCALPKLLLTRRDVLKNTGALSTIAAIAPLGLSAQSGSPACGNTLRDIGTFQDNLFTRLGVRPIINAHGTFTIITGSRSLPEVKQAMFEASQYFVHLDELMPKVGAEIARLMGADSAIVTTGCEAAIALATVACACGTDPELSQAFPYKRHKSQVIIPKHSRNPYDFGVRMTGLEIVEVDSAEELASKLTDQVAMVYILSSPAAENGPLSIASICAASKAKGIPVFVDAAAEEPLVPNIHLQHGASLVGYSGGKCLRGPQAAGLLIGQSDLTRAAWFQASPHHNYGRAYKVGKEEIMGMLAAVRKWYERDHEAEQRAWKSWLDQIADKAKGLPSVRIEYLQPEDLSNRSPRLRVYWDARQLKITGTELVKRLDDGTPRIMIDGGTGIRPAQMESSLTIMPYMLAADEIPVIADAIYAALTQPGSYSDPVVPSGAVNVAGKWAVTLTYTRGTSEQTFVLEQKESQVSGRQMGEIYEAQLQGSIHGSQLKLHARMPVSGHEVIWDFSGTVEGNTASGTVALGEYGSAQWKGARA